MSCPCWTRPTLLTPGWLVLSYSSYPLSISSLIDPTFHSLMVLSALYHYRSLPITLTPGRRIFACWLCTLESTKLRWKLSSLLINSTLFLLRLSNLKIQGLSLEAGFTRLKTHLSLVTKWISLSDCLKIMNWWSHSQSKLKTPDSHPQCFVFASPILLQPYLGLRFSSKIRPIQVRLSHQLSCNLLW